MKSAFKRRINWNKYQSKVTIQAQKQYLDYLIDSSFQGENGLFVLPFENNAHRTFGTRYFFSTVEIKYYIVMINGKRLFNQPVKNDLKAYDKIWKILTGLGDYNTR